MKRDRLMILAKRLEQLGGPGNPGTDRHRRNEPGMMPRRDPMPTGKEQTFQQRKPHILNLDVDVWPDDDSGIGNMALVTTTIFASEAAAMYPKQKNGSEGEGALEATAAEILGIDSDTACVLFNGPNWIGGARLRDPLIFYTDTRGQR